MRKSITEVDGAAPSDPRCRLTSANEAADAAGGERMESPPLRGPKHEEAATAKSWQEEGGKSQQLELTVRCLDNSLRAGLLAASAAATDDEEEEEGGETRERRRMIGRIVTLLCLAGDVTNTLS
jgi:hypothetical protein